MNCWIVIVWRFGLSGSAKSSLVDIAKNWKLGERIAVSSSGRGGARSFLSPIQTRPRPKFVSRTSCLIFLFYCYTTFPREELSEKLGLSEARVQVRLSRLSRLLIGRWCFSLQALDRSYIGVFVFRLLIGCWCVSLYSWMWIGCLMVVRCRSLSWTNLVFILKVFLPTLFRAIVLVSVSTSIFFRFGSRTEEQSAGSMRASYTGRPLLQVWGLFCSSAWPLPALLAGLFLLLTTSSVSSSPCFSQAESRFTEIVFQTVGMEYFTYKIIF